MTDFDALTGAEGVLWVANALGPGLSANWVVAKPDYIVEGFIAARLAGYRKKGAWSARLGTFYDSRYQWGLKLGLALEFSGVSE